jgi:hypothetical protein
MQLQIDIKYHNPLMQEFPIQYQLIVLPLSLYIVKSYFMIVLLNKQYRNDWLLFTISASFYRG